MEWPSRELMTPAEEGERLNCLRHEAAKTSSFYKEIVDYSQLRVLQRNFTSKNTYLWKKFTKFLIANFILQEITSILLSWIVFCCIFTVGVTTFSTFFLIQIYKYYAEFEVSSTLAHFVMFIIEIVVLIGK